MTADGGSSPRPWGRFVPAGGRLELPRRPGGHLPPAPAGCRRRCLMCRGSFASAWAGHRVCDDCKCTEAWRDGALDAPFALGAR